MKILTLALCMLFGSLALQAQYSRFDVSPGLWWVNLGAGMSNISSDQEQLMFYGSFNKPRTERLLLSSRYTYAQELNPFERTNAERNWDLSALASLYFKGDAGYFAVGSGLGLNGGKIREGRLENYLTVGLPLETQLFVTLPSLGLGIVGMVNINAKTTYWGVALAVQFGALR